MKLIYVCQGCVFTTAYKAKASEHHRLPDHRVVCYEGTIAGGLKLVNWLSFLQPTIQV